MYSKSNLQTSDFTGFLWQQIYRDIQRRVDQSTFNSWFRNVRFVAINKNKLEIAVSSKFIREWIINNHMPMLLKVVRYHKAEIDSIEIKVKNPRTLSKQTFTQNLSEAADTATKTRDNKYYGTIASKLNSALTFANLMVGDFNKIAYQSSQKIINKDNHSPNEKLLYVYSRVGMGKTHLLQSIAHATTDSDNKSIYFSAEKFMNQYVYACQQNQLSKFRSFINEHDIFIIDDIQFIIGKTSTQQELIRLIISFLDNDKKVVIASECSPFNLKMERRLISRLTAGMIAEMHYPDYSNRQNIIVSKLLYLKETMADNIINFIAENITNSIRELEGALFKIISHRNILEQNIDLKMAKKILEDNINANNKDITFELISSEVCRYFEIELKELISKCRKKKYVYPRQLVALLAKQLTQDSLQEIGNKLGKRDHATVIYSITKIEEKVQSDETVKQDVAKLMNLICN